MTLKNNENLAFTGLMLILFSGFALFICLIWLILSFVLWTTDYFNGQNLRVAVLSISGFILGIYLLKNNHL